jgi:hypothetical protein
MRHHDFAAVRFLYRARGHGPDDYGLSLARKRQAVERLPLALPTGASFSFLAGILSIANQQNSIIGFFKSHTCLAALIAGGEQG